MRKLIASIGAAMLCFGLAGTAAAATFKPGSNGPDADGDSNLLSSFNGDQAAGMWSLALFDNSTGDTGTLEGFCLYINSVPFSYPDVPKIITENAWVYADILVGDSLSNITDVNVFVDIKHTWIGDLDIYIVHEEEEGSFWVQLYNGDPNEYRNDMTNVLFDDQAATYINEAIPPYTVVPQTAVPLPGAVVLLGSGLGALAAARRARRK